MNIHQSINGGGGWGAGGRGRGSEEVFEK